MSESTTRVLQGLMPPAAVLVFAALLWALLGPGWAMSALALGWGALWLREMRAVDRLAGWAGGPLDAPAPEGTGVWSGAFAALHRRARTRDATERDLSHTIRRFQNAAEAIPDGMVVLDRANRIRWANARAQALLALDIERDIGAPLVNFTRQPEFVRYVESEDQADGIVIDSQRDAGVTLSLQIVPFGIAEKLLIARDVTRLEAVARMRRDFIANVSHELKTPLTVISGFIETLQELDLDELQRRRFMQLMAEQAASMQRLVDDLLTLSALESEQNVLVDETFAIEPLLLEVSSDARNLAQGQHQVSLELRDAAMVSGSRDELKSALGNLVSNAVRYTPAGGSITLSWRIDPDGSGVFAVTDTGIGIAAEHLPRLTERFYRVDRSRSRATGGTGLGLAIVKHVLFRHQAELEIASEPGKGSTFAIRLKPRRVRAVEADAPAPQAAATSTASPNRTGS